MPRYHLKPYPLTEKDINKIEKAILQFEETESQLSRFKKVRNSFMLRYGFYCGGLRPKEIYNAKVSHINHTLLKGQ
jgi:integrase